jgi:protein O-GlcNAc transferase
MGTVEDQSRREAARVAVNFEYSDGLPAILQSLGCSLLVSTYQSRKVFVIGVHHGALEVSTLEIEQPMGIAVGSGAIAIGDRSQIHFYAPQHEVGRASPPIGRFDGAFVPSVSRHTGRVMAHELAWGSDGLWIVNTLFSCLCTLEDHWSFVPRWRPRFISELADEDRCHLNGLAMQDGRPRFVTALASTDQPAGWRRDKTTSGCIVDVVSGETIASGLSMPHSPRLHQGTLWVLDSGHGRLSRVDESRGRCEGVVEVPGFTRGMSIHGNTAFVGMSKIRESNVFGGLAVAEKHDALLCGFAVIDLIAGRAIAKFQFNSIVEEIFAVEAIATNRNPLFSGALVDNQERQVWIVPPTSR